MLKSLHLEVTHRDDLNDDFEGDYNDRFDALSRADRINHLLLYMPNLSRISLHCLSNDYDDEQRGHSEWLTDVFQGHHFEKLTCFVLQDFKCSAGTLQTLLQVHKHTLKTLKLQDMDLDAQEWCKLSEFIRKDLELQNAVMDVSSYLARKPHLPATPELDMIISQHGKGRDKADIGGYVVRIQPQKEIEGQTEAA